MINELGLIIASFTAPENIPTDPKAMLWIFPLLAAIATVYKATKTRVIFMKKFAKSVIVLFTTLSLFLILTAVALHVIVWIFTT